MSNWQIRRLLWIRSCTKCLSKNSTRLSRVASSTRKVSFAPYSSSLCTSRSDKLTEKARNIFYRSGPTRARWFSKSHSPRRSPTGISPTTNSFSRRLETAHISILCNFVMIATMPMENMCRTRLPQSLDLRMLLLCSLHVSHLPLARNMKRLKLLILIFLILQKSQWLQIRPISIKQWTTHILATL